MPLRAFEIGNYRAFAESARVELRPLTLLFGYNNVGKSALARVLPLIRDSVSVRHGLPFNLDSPTVRGGEFADLRCKATGVRKIELALEWEAVDPTYIRLIIQDLPERRQHVIESMELQFDKRSLRANWLPEDTGRVSPRRYLVTTSRGRSELEIGWEGLRPQSLSQETDLEEFLLLDSVDHALDPLSETLWIGAIRAAQPRIQKFPRMEPEWIEHDGEGAADVLAWDKKYGGELFSTVSKWYGEHAQAPLDVALRGDDYALVTGMHQVSLSDTGEGLTQVLPALVGGALARKRALAGDDSYLVVEQPELHLHPRLHAPLARFFCDIAKEASSPRMIVETHSENFLFGVQIAVAKGDLAPEDVLIHWVRQDEAGRATVTPMPFDLEGRPEGWPRGVFTEEADLARELLEARNARVTR
ncbi:MAG TPA: hypothetical protein VF815_17565 [Myxococcaceae bacterium]|jgi:hypothetical protein